MIHVAVVLGRLSFVFSMFLLIRSFFYRLNDGNQHAGSLFTASAVYVLNPKVEGCHSVFNQSIQFIVSHTLTSDKLEPF